MASGDQALHQRDHLRDMFSGAGLHIRGGNAECGHVLIIDAPIFVGDVADLLAGLNCGLHDFVVNIRDVGDISHFRVQRAQHAHQHVEHHGHAGIADMRIGIDGGAAGINLYMRRINRGKRLFLAGEGVIKGQWCGVFRHVPTLSTSADFV